MAKQRWRFTKLKPHYYEFMYCSGCGEKLNLKDKYHRQYGFCDVYCGYTTFGLSWSDFI